VTERRRARRLDPARRVGGLFAAAAVLAGLAACGTSGHGTAEGTSEPAPASTPDTNIPPSLTNGPPLTTPASSPPTTTAAPTTATPAAASSTAPHSTCTNITVRVIPGSASLGQEIAALQFTNEGTKSCVLVGFPAVTLLRKGQVIGSASQPSSLGTSKLTLAAGDVAESILHDYTQTCNAPLSDSVRVRVPGSTTTAIRPTILRACILRVDKLGPPQ
jgi:Protein of unknown function (DUF4232)